MPNPETLIESKEATVDLTVDEALAIAKLGQRLASEKQWWGTTGEPDLAGDERTAIRVRPHGPGQWKVRVNDAIGVFAAGGRQFLVQPKIPTDHLVWLIERSELLPRIDPQATTLSEGSSFLELVARWFIHATEQLLRRDLIRDYRPTREALAIARGRIDPLATTSALLKGRVEVHCEFDEFDADNPLNRLLLAAARQLSASPLLARHLRQRARRVSLRLDGISAMRPADLYAQVDRRTSHYGDAIALARSIIASTARSLEAGPAAAWSFLIRTPDLVEAGLRNVIADALSGMCAVTKKGVAAGGSTVTFNPDLVFNGGEATGDIKYKVAGRDWNRSDLYQAIAFATAYDTKHATVVTFATDDQTLGSLQVGTMAITHLVWPTGPAWSPRQAQDIFGASIKEWFAKLHPVAGAATIA
ncbi:McrC family protein [Aquihabitans daechungensis]|uniref:McrC family protein n=1 Tax=Aquihabitans daechungensis TaxID=1052257 RepID=UPI003B9F4FA9